MSAPLQDANKILVLGGEKPCDREAVCVEKNRLWKNSRKKLHARTIWQEMILCTEMSLCQYSLKFRDHKACKKKSCINC